MDSSESRQEALRARREMHVPRGVGNAHPIFIDRAEGAHMWDIDGKEYIDFAGGIGVMNVGHSHPRVLQAIQEQLARFTHTCFQVTMYEPYIELAERLNALAPGEGPHKTIFFTSGAEAVENAVKIARAATGRQAIIAFNNSFHGRTLMGMSLTGKSSYKQNFGPFAPEIYHVPYPYEYRGWNTAQALHALQELFDTEVAATQVAAVIIEPVLGEGGFVAAPADFMQELRRITAEHGILLIADEIQSGFGRTGKFFAIEHSEVVPDLITVAKSLAAGLPLSGVIGRAEVMDAPAPGGLGGTYGGNPLACAAALAVLDVFEEEHLLEQGVLLGGALMSEFRMLQQRFDQVDDVRGLGPMVAMEIVRSSATREPAPELVDQIVKNARERGLILIKAGLYGNVIRVLVPLTVDPMALRHGLEILTACLEDVLTPVAQLA